MLRAHARLPRHNIPGTPVTEALAEARGLAASRGLPWKGLDFVVIDHAGDVGGLSNAALLQLYQRRACQADAIAVGRVTMWSHHLSASGTAVYGDYVFVIDALLKDNQTASIQSKPDLVVTKPGGALTLADGPVNFEFQEFPHLQSGATYLLFLRYIAESSGYEALDSFSTLVVAGAHWAITRKAFSGLAVPGFTRNELETAIREWLVSCK